MSALAYILHRSLKNIIKELIRKPAALIAYIIIACFFIGTFIMSLLMPQTNTEMVNMDITKAIFVGYTAFLLVIAITTSLGGVSFFRMADVNMLFTAPIKAGYILIYGFVKQLAGNFMIMLFLALQYPNWKRMFGFIDGAGWILMVSYMLLLALTSLLGMALYACISKKPHRKPLAKGIIYALVAAFLLPIIINTYKSGDVLNSMLVWLSNDNLRFVPIIGWFREVLIGTYTGITAQVIFYAALILLTGLAAFIYLYHMDTGFYEHVLSGTEHKELVVKSMREGKTPSKNISRRYRKVKGRFTREGSLAIFQRQMLEKRKSGFWLISARTLILAAGASIAAVSIPVDSLNLVLGILTASAYIMFIYAMIGSLEGDLSSHYIYMIPAAPMKKMFFSTLSEVLKIVVEGLLIFACVGFILKVPLDIILSAVFAYVSIGAVFIYSDLVVRRLFGKIHGNVLRIFFRILLLMVIIAFVVTPAVIVGITAGSHTMAYITAALVNLVLVLIFMFIGTGLFKYPEI
jgi:hypothetical protein